MLAIYNPYRDGLKTYRKYNIEVLQGAFRSIMVLKNRFGDCDAEVGCNFFGGINYFSELKKPDEIYDYEQYTDPNYLLKDSMKEDNIKENKEDQNNSNLNFIL